MKRNRLLLVIGISLLSVMLVSLLITACSPGTTTPTPTGTATPTPGQTTTPTPTAPGGIQTVNIGLAGAFTGAYAPYGGPFRDSTRNAVKMFNEQGFVVNGQTYKINLIEYDDRTDTKRAVAGLTMLKDIYDIKMVLGPFTSPTTLAAQPIAETRKIILLSTGSATETTRPTIRWTFVNTTPHSYRAIFFSKYYCGELGVKTAAIMTENNATYLSIKQGADEFWPKNGATVVANELFEMGTTDFSTTIARIRQKNPDVLHINAIPASSILITKQVYEAGWHVQIVSYVDLISDDLFRVAGKAAEGVMGGGGVNYWSISKGQVPESAIEAIGIQKDWYLQVCESYKADYGDKNMNFAMQFYTYTNVFVNLMQQAGTIDDVDKLHNMMDTLTFQDATKVIKILPMHRFKMDEPIAVFHESTVGADKFDILAIATHNDQEMLDWKLDIINPYPKIDEIRKTRGY